MNAVRIWILLPLLASLFCQGQSGTQTAETAKTIYADAKDSVFLIYINDGSGNPAAFGTGFQIAPRSLVTNAHVVEKGTPVLAVGPVRIPAKIEKIDHQRDLAILAVDAELTSKPLHLASRPVTPGERIFTIGNPEGLENTISQGIVSGIRQDKNRTLIQITSPISHGSSGGPVLNSQGEVIGIAVGMLEEGQNLNFAVPVSDLQVLLASANTLSKPATFSSNELKASFYRLDQLTYSADTSSPFQRQLADIVSTVKSQWQRLLTPAFYTTLHA